MEEDCYFYDSKTETLREVIAPLEVVHFLAAANTQRAIFFSGTGTLETTREPFVINKIA